MQVVSVDVDTFSQYYLVAMATSLDKLEKKATDPSSARNALSYGVKTVKIGPVDPEISDQIGPFWSCHTRRSQMSPVNSGVTGPNFTKFSHNIQASIALLTRIDVAISHTVSESQNPLNRLTKNLV